MADDLVTWLREQFDDDERVAREGTPFGTGRWLAEDSGLIRDSDGGCVVHDDGEQDRATAEHIARHDPARVLAEVDAKRRILDEWQQQADKVAEWYAKSDAELHAHFSHPDYEYETTEGQRKAWDYSDVPPEGEGWERNVEAGIPGEGWERFDYHEESYWRRLLPEDRRGRKVPDPPRYIKLLALSCADRPGYRDEWKP